MCSSQFVKRDADTEKIIIILRVVLGLARGVERRQQMISIADARGYTNGYVFLPDRYNLIPPMNNEDFKMPFDCYC